MNNEYPRVETCSVCGRDFLAGVRDNGVCLSCFHKREREKVETREEIQKPTRESRQPQTEQQKPGHVYMMKSGGWCKIGMTSRQSGRLGELRGLFPVIKLIHQIECNDAGKVETYLHKKFKKQRVTREWYKLTKEDIAWFKSLKDCDLDELV